MATFQKSDVEPFIDDFFSQVCELLKGNPALRRHQNQMKIHRLPADKNAWCLWYIWQAVLINTALKGLNTVVIDLNIPLHIIIGNQTITRSENYSLQFNKIKTAFQNFTKSDTRCINATHHSFSIFRRIILRYVRNFTSKCPHSEKTKFPLWAPRTN